MFQKHIQTQKTRFKGHEPHTLSARCLVVLNQVWLLVWLHAFLGLHVCLCERDLSQKKNGQGKEARFGLELGLSHLSLSALGACVC